MNWIANRYLTLENDSAGASVCESEWAVQYDTMG